MELLKSIVAGGFDVLLHASLIGIICLWAGWMRSAFERRPKPRRLVIWSAVFLAMAAIAMLEPTQPLPGLRLDIRSAILALSVVFCGPAVGGIVAAGEILIRILLGGPLALTGAIGIALTYLAATLIASRSRGREPT